MQDVLDAAADSPAVDASGALNPSDNDTPPTSTASTVPTSPECSLYAPNPLSSPQHTSPAPKRGFETRSTQNDALIGHSKPRESLKVDAGVNGNPLEDLESRKPAVVAANEPEPRSSATRRIVRKKGLPEFSPTRLGIFSTAIIDVSENASLGKRKRSREENGERGTDPQRGGEILLPR